MLIGLVEGLGSADPPLAAGRAATRAGLGGAADRGRAADPQERAAGGRGPGRRGASAPTSRCSPTARPDADHDVRRLRDRLHRHPDAARRAGRRRRAAADHPRGPGSGRLRGPGVRRARSRELAEAADQCVRPGDLDARRRRHQLPERRPAGRSRVASFAAKAAPHRRRAARVLRPAARDHRPDRGPGDHLRAQRRAGRGRPARRPGGRARRPRHGPGDRERGPVRLRQPAPAGRARRGARRASRRTSCCAGAGAQVQIRTVLQHAWAEFEHDIRYKGTIPDEHVPDFDRRFTLAAGLLELADREFSTIRDRLQAGMTGQPPSREDDDPRISPRELAAFLAGQYADAGWSRTDHYAWISGLLLELGITSLDELGDVLRSVDGAAIRADGLPVPARCGPPARRRAAGGVRRHATSSSAATPTGCRRCGPGWTGSAAPADPRSPRYRETMEETVMGVDQAVAAQRRHPALHSAQLERAENVQLRLADSITRYAGSMRFVYPTPSAFAAWMLVLREAARGRRSRSWSHWRRSSSRRS